MRNHGQWVGALAVMAGLLVAVGVWQSWSLALTILNYCLISSIMALGLNQQWGHAGLFNVGVMGFAALGGIAAVLVSLPPVAEAWRAGGMGIAAGLAIFAVLAAGAWLGMRRLRPGWRRRVLLTLWLVIGFWLARLVLDPAVARVESVNPAQTGFLGGMGLPIVWSWLVGGCLAAAAAWAIGRITLGLRSDYLAIATLGISEIIIAFLKYEEWLTRGVKNVNGLPRPVPYELDLQKADWVVQWSERLAVTSQEMAGIAVKLAYAGLSVTVLVVLYALAQAALNAPWGRMMRAIRDNEAAAEAMGKDVKRQHLIVFVIGSAIIGLAGAMMTTLDGQFTPTSYNPLRFTFLIWVMVIVGGSGNNLGSVLGGFLIWFFWVEAEPIGRGVIEWLTAGMGQGDALRLHLLDSAVYARPVIMGLVLLLVLRFRPAGMLPEQRIKPLATGSSRRAK
jgi:branched-chain amino acid transport system permease protein